MQTVCSPDNCSFLTYYSLSYLIIKKPEDRGSMLLRSSVFSTLPHSVLPQKIEEWSEKFLVKLSDDQLLTKYSAACSRTLNSLSLFKLVAFFKYMNLVMKETGCRCYWDWNLDSVTAWCRPALIVALRQWIPALGVPVDKAVGVWIDHTIPS
jgi:hypothetical protein